MHIIGWVVIITLAAVISWMIFFVIDHLMRKKCTMNFEPYTLVECNEKTTCYMCNNPYCYFRKDPKADCMYQSNIFPCIHTEYLTKEECLNCEYNANKAIMKG